MKHRYRAGGIAAALLALVATTAVAGPSAATRANTVAASAVADHVPIMIAHARAAETAFNARTGTKAAAPAGLETPSTIVEGLARESAVSVEARRLLRRLVNAHASSSISDPERECLAVAVYFEAQGEPLEGQLAVAEVVLNRAASGEYPRSICAVVTQPAQFSFVLDGRFPAVDRGTAGWRKAVAIAHIAAEELADSLSSDVLWYHADYVAPGWGRRLDRATQIGAHIFYRRG